MTYYDEIAKGYDELHGEEQQKKFEMISEWLSDLSDFSLGEGDKLLDVGCGTGLLTEQFRKKFSCVCVGVDPAEELIKIARSRGEGSDDNDVDGGVVYFVGKGEGLSFSDEEFTVVVSVTALQNFSDAKKGLEKMKRVGKDVFCISFLKKSSKAEQLGEFILDVFSAFSIRVIEEEKDLIYFITKTNS